MDGDHGPLKGDVHQADEVDNFKPVYKKYKRRDQPVDLKDVVDLHKITDVSSSFVEQLKPVIPSKTPVAGLRPAQDWAIFHFVHHPGFYIIQNPFLAGYQRYWTSRCLQDFPRPPHHTNLTVHPNLDPNTLWDSYLDDFRHRGSNANNSSSPIRKLRWTTIGYHYQWTAKVYKEEDHTPFPHDVAALAHYVACVLGFPQFQAESGIINYYYPDSALGPHTDHSELDHDAPLISFSFGQDAVFLMGGLTKAQTPTAVWLHSGDICVMSGEARLAYHSVPRIVPSLSGTAPPCFDMVPEDWKMVDSWAGGMEDTPDSDGDQGQSPPPQSIQAASEPCPVFPIRVTNSSQERGSPTSAADGSFHVGDSEENVREERGSQGAASNGTDVSTQDATSSQESDSHSFDRNSTQRISNKSDPQAVAVDSSVSALTTTQRTDSVQSDSPTSAYEDRVKVVNRQLATTLRKQDWGPFAAYLSSSRLNVNIRQVLKAGQSFSDAGGQDSAGRV